MFHSKEVAMIDVQKLSSAVVEASSHPAALKQLRSAWAELLTAVHSRGVPLPPPPVELGQISLTWDWRGGGIVNVHACRADDGVDEEARALIELVPAFVQYLERVAQTARDALVVADALRKALADLQSGRTGDGE
jgi:hypothetical protein